jgi:acetoin utilization protein AcuB
LHALPVVDPGERLVGIVTDVDVLASLARNDSQPLPRSNVSVNVVMTPNPITIDRDASLADAADAILRGRVRHLPVLDDQGQLVGMLSERDLRSRLGADVQGFPHATLEALSEPVSEAMTPDPITVRSGTPLDDVLETFASERVGALPVVDEADTLLGIVSYVDVMMWLRGERSRIAPQKPRP